MPGQDHSLKPIADMDDLCPEFKAQAARMGINCLKDVLEQDARQLKAHPAFSYLWYADLLDLLKKENLLDAFQDKLF